MQQSQTASARPRRPRPTPRRGAAVRSLLEALARKGLKADVLRCGAHYTASGVAARVCLKSLVVGSTKQASDFALISAALRAGLPVTVTVADPDRQAASAAVAPFRDSFCRYLERAAIDRRLLGLSLTAGELPAPEFRASLRPQLGEGPRYVMLPTGNAPGTDSRPPPLWRLLQECEARGPRFWPALPSGVRSRCPLLPSESSEVLLPNLGLAAPTATAWLPIHLDLGRFCGARGELASGALAEALDACVALGDRLFDHLTWFDPRQRRDAYRNRRLAICVSGFGDWLLRRGADPCDWHTLRQLDRLIGSLQEGLWLRSKRLAKRRGAIPALFDREPQWTWCDEAHSRAWRRRWKAALNAEQVRHRNLLVLSPYSILPRDGAAAIEFADLVPALAHADAFYFSGAPALDHWRGSDFRAFHQRVQALVARHNAASFVAAGV